MFTDVEIALLARHRRDLNAYAGDSQSVVDRVAAERDAALDEVATLLAQLRTETARRQASELQVEALKKLARSLA